MNRDWSQKIRTLRPANYPKSMSKEKVGSKQSDGSRPLKQRHAESLFRTAYKVFLRREADQPGLSHFLNRSESESVSQLISEIRNSEESRRPPHATLESVLQRSKATQREGVGTVYYYVDHTVNCPANTGLQRVVRMLAKAMMSLDVRVLFVKWSSAHKTFVFINAEELAHLSQWNGPSVRPHDAEFYPSGQLDGPVIGQAEIPNDSWLLIPEVTHITYKTDLHTRDVLKASRCLGLRTACIFYDAIPLRREELRGCADVHLDYMKCLVDADLLLPISQWSCDDLLRFAEIDTSSASPVPSIAVLPMPSESILGSRKRNLKEIVSRAERKLLSVGSITPHKNQIALVRAFNSFCAKNPSSDWKLHLIGHVHPLVEESLRTLIASNPKISHTQGATDDELRIAYETCAFTVFPSIEEGFGLPIVESLWFGRPCICANFGAMAEAGNKPGCVAIDTNDLVEIEEAISNLIKEPDLLVSLFSAIISIDLDTWRDYAGRVVALLGNSRKQDEAGARAFRDEDPIGASPRALSKDRRIFWLGMHKILVQTELKRLRELGYEVFNPPYLSNIADQSANLNWDSTQETTLPRDVFDKLATTNFFYEKVDESVQGILNEYFGSVVVTINPMWLETILDGYVGRVIYRVYGQSHSLSVEVRNRGLTPKIVGNNQFVLMPHAVEALGDEESWLRANEDIVPYCLTDDIFGYQDTWDVSSVVHGCVGLTCPNIANPYYRAHYDHLKAFYKRDYFRIYGVQLSEVDDPAVVGTLPRHVLIDEFTKMAAYIYTYDDPRVCYLPPIEAMIVGVPVVFVKGSLLDKYFHSDTPARCDSPEGAMLLTDRIKRGDIALVNEIKKHQGAVRKRYSPGYVWPIFDAVMRSRIPCAFK